MNKFIFWILVSPLFILGLTVNLHAGQAEPMSFTKRVSSADLVILATVDSAESRIVGGTENATTLKAAAKIYTVLSLNTVDVISDQGLVALSTGVRLYLDGGVVEMPPALEDKFPGQKYLGSINTAVPHVDSSGISKYIILICGNGQQSVPICGGEEGVFPITLDGYVQTADGRPILGLVGDDLVVENPAIEKPQPIKAEGPVPPPDLIQEPGNILATRPFSVEDFVSVVRRLVGNVDALNEGVTEITRPTRVSELFEVR